MKTLEDQLSQYAAYHRDGRNIATHFFGIPMIVAAITVLLSRPGLAVGTVVLTPAALAAVVAGFYYLRLDRPLGLLMCALLAVSVGFGAWAASLTTTAWLALGAGLFVVGWALQFAGHAWEGRKPAFVDDIAGLIIGPLFVVTEALFMAGLLPKLRATVESRAARARESATVLAPSVR